MHKFGESQSIKRTEDTRFLVGQGKYVDDIAPQGALHGFVFRSPVAHATIVSLDVEAARALPGVQMVLTVETLEQAGLPLDIEASLVTNLDGTKGASPLRPHLAKGRVRFVGEAVAMIIADTLNIAKEAAELIEFEYDELEPSMGLHPGGETLHTEAPGNLAFDWGLGDEAATEAALAGSVRRIKLEIADNRVIANSMEPRAAYAEWVEGRAHLCFGGQGVWGMKGRLAAFFSLPKDAIRVTIPDVGGGFGMKGFPYPEYFLITFAARELGQPVRWFSERTEAMLSDNAGRDLVSVAELGFDENNKITAYRVETRCNLGAYNSDFAQEIQTSLFAKVFPGTYDIKTGYLGVKGIYTNTTQVDAYRGAGRPEAIYVLERIMDYAARELGVSPWELRRRNFIPVEAFPYTSISDVTYDCGDFRRVLDRIAETADVAGFAARRAASAAQGKLRGMGLCYYIESILGNPSEVAAMEFNDDGTVSLFVGTQSNGQGHETVYAQFLSDQTGVPFEQIVIVQGDSDRIASGGGTGGSRSVTVQNTATLATVDVMVASFIPFVAGQLEVDADDVEFDGTRFRADGSNRTPDMLEVAGMARAAGRMDLLEHTATITLEQRSFPNGAHVAEVEIDPDTGVVEVAKYTVADDFGNLVHPMLVEGQIHGGVAQGIGQALSEHVVYDESGQLLTATFMDYAMPRADNVPMIDFSTVPLPTKTNPLGMKGCGEAGTVGALAAVTNGVLDAVWDTGVRQVDMPFTPNRMWEMLSDRPIAAE
jgi:carbon-monoxide dehydrogenase large subunit